MCKPSPNKYAKMTYGNRINSRGIKNLHLNIRSLCNKMPDLKQLVSQHKPHILGISECELRRSQLSACSLNIPGYSLLFPKSWVLHDYARIVVYVKSSLDFEQVHEIEDVDIQSVWFRGGFKNCKKIY